MKDEAIGTIDYFTRSIEAAFSTVLSVAVVWMARDDSRPRVQQLSSWAIKILLKSNYWRPILVLKATGPVLKLQLLKKSSETSRGVITALTALLDRTS